MSRKIEDAFNDCFERLLTGESLDSCLNSYPEHAAELDSMLRATFDVKRMAYPVQPRPEFKYWARVRMQGVQQASVQDNKSAKVSSFNIRRNLAISLAALLVFVMASTGTVAASSDALPDQPLYDVKLAVEQVQLTFTPSDAMKAELYANLAEKRAREIAVMASQGKTDKVLSTTTRMYDQLDKAEQLIANMESSTEESSNAAFSAPIMSAPVPPTDSKSVTTSPADSTTTQGQGTGSQSDSKSGQQKTRALNAVEKAKLAVSASAANTVTILENARDKADDSVKPSLNTIIERTKTSNARLNTQTSVTNTAENQDKASSENRNTGTDKNLQVKPRILVPSDNTSKPINKTNTDRYNKEIYNQQNSNQSSTIQETTTSTPTSVTNIRTITPGTLTPITNTPVINTPKLPYRGVMTVTTPVNTGKTVDQLNTPR